MLTMTKAGEPFESLLPVTTRVGWRITVQPSGDGDVTVVLPETTDRDDDGSICTEDGKTRSSRLELTASGPSQRRSFARWYNGSRHPETGNMIHGSLPAPEVPMTTADANTTKSPGHFRLPDPPQREPDEMTQYDQLTKTGNARYLAVHLGNAGSTLVEADRWIIARPEDDLTRARRPDLVVAFDVDPVPYEASNGYVVSEQGKPPDFVLEIASESTAETDVGAKRDEYAALGIREYWRFDKTGEFHGVRLAGDQLVEGAYQPIPIEQLDDGVLQGYSPALDLNLRWEGGQLGWHDPATGQHIPTYEDQRNQAHYERTRAETAEARVRELEAELQRLRQG